MCSIEQTHFSRHRIIAVVLLDLKEADMAGSGPANSNCGNLDADKEQREKERSTTEQTEERNLNQGLEAEEKDREEGRSIAQRDKQQDLNQGMETGTHDSIRHGVDWGPAYQKKREPNKKSD
jgi:hypothetical protein